MKLLIKYFKKKLIIYISITLYDKNSIYTQFCMVFSSSIKSGRFFS